MKPRRLVTAIALAVLLVAVASRAAVQEPVVLLEPPEGCSFQGWLADLQQRGVRLTHLFPPSGGLLIPGPTQGLYTVIADLPPGTRYFEESPVGPDAEKLKASVEGRALWHAQRALLGLEGPAAAAYEIPGKPLDHDALEPPTVSITEAACSAYALYRTTSEYLLGRVSVSIILPESTGAASTEDWTATLETNVTNGIVQGLNELSTYYSTLFSLPAGLKPAWTYHFYFGRTDSRAQVTVEPIGNPGPTASNPQWVNTIYDNFGYSSDSTMMDKGSHFNGDKRAADGTDWAYTVFVANSLNDADGEFSDFTFAYSYLGGPFLVMTYDNATWGIDKMNYVARHETSHIFYALDEYYSSPCTCTQTSGYVSYQNQNCNKSCLIDVPCIMNEWFSQYNMCTYTAGQIGWGDSDSDRIPDPVDIAPETALTPYTPDPTANTTLTYSGTATIQANPNQNIYHYMCDLNMLTLSSVQYRVDGGTWLGATATDGAFNGGSEAYTFNVTLSQGTHTIETRAMDELGQTDASPASDTVTVTAACADSYEPNDTCGTAYALACGTSINDAKICSAADLDYFAVTPSLTGTLTVSMTPPSGLDYDLLVYSNDCATTLCAPAVRGSGTETCSISVSGGTTYKILVTGYGGAYDVANPYWLTISCSCNLPACAAAPSPANGATGVSTTPTLTWSAVSGATSYDVYFGTASPPPLVSNVTSPVYTPGTLTASTTYRWKVVPKNTCGTASACTEWSFTTVSCTVPACATGPSPANGATGVSTSPTLTWSTVSAAASYDVYFGTASPPPWVTNVTSPLYTPGTLTAGTTYRWKVISKNACGDATGCAEWSFTTACQVPACAAAPSPANGATGVSTTPTLTWSAVSGATSYDVYFGTASPPPLVGNVATPAYAPGTLTAGTLYHWKVVPKNACGTASPCTEWSFTTVSCTVPACATGPSPANGAAGVSTTPTLTWSAVSGAASYDVYLGTASPPPLVGNVATPAYVPGTLTSGTTYRWKVISKNACGDAMGCAEWSFTTACQVPACATAPSPANGATTVSTTPTLTWSAVSGATSYDVYFGTASPPPLVGNVATPAYAPGTLTAGTLYHWKVVPKNACGTASPCTEWTFTTATCQVPACAAGPSPADAATGVSTAPTLTWSAAGGVTSYDVFFGTASPPPLVANVTSPTYTPGALTANTTYHWKVAPKNGCGETTGCTEWSFTTSVLPPVVQSVGKVPSPFRIKVSGSNFQQGMQVYVAGTLWGDTTAPTLVKWKSDGLIVIKKGAPLKTLFPKYVFVPVKLVNPDGGSVTFEFDRKTKAWRIVP